MNQIMMWIPLAFLQGFLKRELNKDVFKWKPWKLILCHNHSNPWDLNANKDSWYIPSSDIIFQWHPADNQYAPNTWWWSWAYHDSLSKPGHELQLPQSRTFPQNTQPPAKTALSLTLLLLEGLYGSRVMHHGASRQRSSRAEDEGRIHGEVWSDRVGVSPLRNPTPVYPRAPPSGAVVMVTCCKRTDWHPSVARWMTRVHTQRAVAFRLRYF